jgi:hypothetical protein
MISLANYREYFSFHPKLGPIWKIKNPKTWSEVVINGTPLEWSLREPILMIEEIQVPEYIEEKFDSKVLDDKIKIEDQNMKKVDDRKKKKEIKVVSYKQLKKKEKLEKFNERKKMITRKIKQRRDNKQNFEHKHYGDDVCNCKYCTDSTYGTVIDDEDDWCGCYVCKPEKNSYILSKSENDSYYSDSYYYDSDDYDW